MIKLSSLALQTIFKQRIVHGMLTGSMFSAMIGHTFPLSVYMKQEFQFKAPVFINEDVISNKK